jgi:hypothetical protein
LGRTRRFLNWRFGGYQTVARQECRRVHGTQAARSHVTDDDGLHAVDSVHADDFCVRHHRQLIPRGSAQASQAWHYSAARMQDNEHTLAAPQSINGRSDGGSLVAIDNEIDGCVLHHIAPEVPSQSRLFLVPSTIAIGRREEIERNG